ncbi:putative GIY-YIG endonuclease [Plasmopara halstedii]
MIGYIYKITNADESIVYVGSTTLTLGRRWGNHSEAYKRWIESKGSYDFPSLSRAWH